MGHTFGLASGHGIVAIVLAWLLLAGLGENGAAAEPPALTVVRLGGEADPALLTQGEHASVTLRGSGREAFLGADEGTFAYLRTHEKNFTFTARIAKVTASSPNPKYGLSLRTDLSGKDRCVNLRYDGFERNRCVQWFLRYMAAPGAHDGSKRCYLSDLERGLTATEGFWLRIQRRHPAILLFHSTDGQNWTPVAAQQYLALVQQDVYIGLQVTAGGDGKGSTEVVFDQLDFAVAPPETADVPVSSPSPRGVFAELPPKMPTWRMHLVQAEGARGKGEKASAFLLMPKDMDPRSIRAVLLSAGSKEEVVDGKPLPFDSGTGGERKPTAMSQWQGTLDLENIRPFNAMLAQQGIVRVGGTFEAKNYPVVIPQIAQQAGIPWLPNVPLLITGASFAGGQTAQATIAMPEKTIASAPVIIGMAGADTKDPRVLAVPMLRVFGSIDGGHLKDADKWTAPLREQHALWASVPMWEVAHRQHKANAIIYPYFFRMMLARLPEGADYTAGPVQLKPLDEQAGYFGLTDTWTSNFPRAVPVKDFSGDASRAVWLPDEYTARLWQAFVSNNPRTVILFPTYDGDTTFGGALPKGYHQSFMPADEPFELLATGPVGANVRVEYFAGLQPLKVIGGDGYHVLLEGLPPGTYPIYAITTLDGQSEISRPALITFTPRGVTP